MPVYNDWATASAVCRGLDRELSSLAFHIRCRVLLVDDGSPEGIAGWSDFPAEALDSIQVLHLRTNVGHQRAICLGLCFLHEQVRTRWVVVMDSDGEDRPEDAVRLMQQAMDGCPGPIFAARRKRFEGLVFRAGYAAYRRLHRALTGHSVQVGNFSILPGSILPRLVSMPELWNHYAGAVCLSKVPITLEPMDRGKRLQGRSHMNLASLVAHGLAGIATFHEVVAARLLIANFIAGSILLLLLGGVIGIRLGTHWAVPGWATYSAGLLILLALQFLAISFNLVFTLISNRVRAPFVPIRDYVGLIDRIETRSLQAQSVR